MSSGVAFTYPHPSHVGSTLPLVAELPEHPNFRTAKRRLRFCAYMR